MSVRIRAGTVSIPPDTPTTVGGHRPGLSYDVGTDPLEANALILSDDRARVDPIVIISLDVLYAGCDVEDQIRRTVPELANAHIWLCASHTHRAPMVDWTKPRIGTFEAAYASRWGDALCQLLADLVRTEPRIAEAVSIGESRADHSVNRRRRRGLGARGAAHVRLGPNFRGARDETVSYLEFSGDGEVVAVVWSYACHPVGTPAARGVTSDYPGVLRSRLREGFGQRDLPVLFVQGASGNTRPRATSRRLRLSRRPPFLRVWPHFSDMSGREYDRWCHSLYRVLAQARSDRQRMDLAGVSAVSEAIPMEELVHGGAPAGTDTMALQVASLHGPTTVTLIGVGAEVMAELGMDLRRELAPRRVLTVGCVNATFGYLPSASMIDEGGYEGAGFCPLFGIAGVRAEAEAMVHRQALKLISALDGDSDRERE